MTMFSFPPIGLGCMSLPVKDEQKCLQMLQHAFDMGIRFLDTADIYDKGMNETIIGKAIHSRRDDILLATKVGNQISNDASGLVWNPRKEYIIKAVEESLRRLRTTYIDLYQLHGGTVDDPIDESIEAFELLKSSGKIRAYGISSIRQNVIREYVKRSQISSVMLQYSLADRRPEEQILPLLDENGISVLARGTLAKGLLVGKPAVEHLGHSAGEIAAAAATVAACSTQNRSPVQTAIRYVLHGRPFVTAIVGVSNFIQLDEIAGAINTPVLSDEEYEILRTSLPAKIYSDHR